MGWGGWAGVGVRRDSWGELQPQGKGQKKRQMGVYGGFWDERLLPVDRGKVLHNRETETEGEANRGWEGCLLNAAP